MNQRLLQFLSAENISQAQFADTIGVARASVSHILAGRNKPGFDFIESMSSHFPDLSLEWLINGKGKMYKSQASSLPSPSPVVSDVVAAPVPPAGSAAVLGRQEASEAAPAATVPVQPAAPRRSPENAVSDGGSIFPSGPASKMSSLIGEAAQRSISRIIVFYDDNTYQELK